MIPIIFPIKIHGYSKQWMSFYGECNHEQNQKKVLGIF